MMELLTRTIISSTTVSALKSAGRMNSEASKNTKCVFFIKESPGRSEPDPFQLHRIACLAQIVTPKADHEPAEKADSSPQKYLNFL
jgi:hypothetical protein